MSDLRQILDALAGGQIPPAEAERRVRELAQQPLGFATLDHHRHRRCGIPEVVFAAGKTPGQVVEIARNLVKRSGCALVTRAGEAHAAELERAFPGLCAGSRRRTLLVGDPPAVRPGPAVPIVTAGTSDEPVAEEAELTCRAMGQAVLRINDVGVAGLARLIDRLDHLKNGAGVIVCIAGMEGALPSVLAGLVDVPVIAVPTSVGYGANLGGLAALLGMLSSCAAGITVVNIDNGFGAAYAATLIQRSTAGRG